ncbi:hypothetical protein KY334_03670 [Candidatus Woesearchaeota archaeon]|nr:hypothetical protein [Candidatus Woesearchaeota archaeon]
MNSIQEHHNMFKEVIRKYNLDSPEKAEELAHYLVSNNGVSVEEFSKIFAMNEEDAEILLSFILKGIRFKEEHIDA